MTDWVVDLDGVMWRGRKPIAGSAEAIARLLDRGDRVLFCTNNSAESGDARSARLLEQGIPPGCDVVTSADAVCALVAPGEQVLVLGGSGLVAALAAHGALPTAAVEVDPGPLARAAAERARGDESAPPFDAVVIGLTRDFDYRQLDAVSAALRCGARFLASNNDTTFPGADGLHPGCGSLLAAVEAAAGGTALVAGKPHQPMADLIRAHFGTSDAGDSEVVVVGDRVDTDGRLAVALGAPFALVLSGVTTSVDPDGDVPVAVVAATLAELVAARLAGDHQIDDGV